MHRNGINLRYLGYLRSNVACLELRNYILTEVIARVVKNEVRTAMRNIRSSNDEEYLEVSK
jgi:hypothetical protein